MSHWITDIIQWLQKNSKAAQKMVSHTRQHLLPVCRPSKKTSNGHGTRHGTENDEEVLFPLSCGHSRHELHPSVLTRFHQGGNSFSNTEFGATNLRCQCCDRAAGIGMITMLG